MFGGGGAGPMGAKDKSKATSCSLGACVIGAEADSHLVKTSNT